MFARQAAGEEGRRSSRKRRCAGSNRAAWNQWRAALERDIEREGAIRDFAALRSSPFIEPFARPRDLVCYLLALDGDLDDKDRVYAALLREFRDRGQAAKLAATLIWLGLWPALTSMMTRSWRRGQRADCSDTAAAFVEALARVNPDRVVRVAGALIRSAKCHLQRLMLRQLPPAPTDEPSLRDHELPTCSPRVRDLVPSDLTDVAEVAALRLWLVEMIGADSDFVVCALVLGETRAELARRTGLTAKAVQKRIDRALARVREIFKKEKISCLHFRGRRQFLYLMGTASLFALPAVRCPNHPSGRHRPAGTVQVGARLYCEPCARRLCRPEHATRPLPDHLFDTACWFTGNLRPSAICPRCLYDAFHA